MGIVYKAKDRRLKRPVAVKLLPPELAFREEVRSRFLREAQTAAQLSHPNIVPIYSVDEVDGLVFFVMALVEGESLGFHLKRERRAPLDFAHRVLCDVADALSYAHARSIVHRDIKPDNILMDRVTGRTLVSDFGIARAAEGDSRLTVTGIAVGTPAYMSPEQAIGERDIDGRSDLYSLGVVGYQMLTGELPFAANNTPAMLMKHINEAPRPIRDLRPDVPAGLDRAIERAMAKKADQRWSDAAAFRDSLSDDSVRSAPVRDAVAARLEAPRPNAGQLNDRPPATHRAVRDVAPPRRYVPTAPPLAPPVPPWLQPRGTTDGSQPAIPPWMPNSWRDVRREWRQYNKDQRRLLKEQIREQRRAYARGAVMPPGFAPGQEVPIEYRIRAFRMHVARLGTTAAILAGVNLVTSPMVPWFLVPAAFMSLSVLRRGGALWAEGVRLRDIFGNDARLPARGATATAGQALGVSAASRAPQRAAGLVPREVLDGPHGTKVMRAAEDEAEIIEAIEKLAKADRDMIPDVRPTVESLVERVAALAQALQRLDQDVTPETLSRIDARISAAAAEPDTSDREKRLALLRRQRATLDDLLGRRESLVSQLESASLMLQNIRIDLIALRAAGVQSSIDDGSSATQEARALSRDIGHVLEAAKQVRE